MLIHNKDDIQFVTEFLCFLGHPVSEEVVAVTLDSVGSLYPSPPSEDESETELNMTETGVKRTP